MHIWHQALPLPRLRWPLRLASSYRILLTYCGFFAHYRSLLLRYTSLFDLPEAEYDTRAIERSHDLLPKAHSPALPPLASSDLLRLSPFLRFTLNNHDAPDAPRPCSLDHQDFVDFSSMALQPSNLKHAMHRFWRGTCRSLSNEETCTVVASRRGAWDS